MNRTSRILVIACLVFAAIALFTSIFNFFNNPKIAFVRNQELVYGYAGMKDANKKYEEETKGWQATIDSLEKNFHIQLSKYNSTYTELNSKDKQSFEERLENQRLQLLKLKEAVGKKMEEKDLEITQKVLNQINSFVKEYAQKNGYKLIIGTTEDGNLMYADETLDVTDDVLSELNIKYLN